MRRFAVPLMLAIVVLGFTAHGALSNPSYTLPPEVQGRAQIPERLVCGSGSWSGSVSRFEYEWVRSGVIVAKGVTYNTTKADEGKEIWCIVKAISSEGTAEVESANSLRMPGGSSKEPEGTAPAALTPPKVSGEGAVGANLACSTGSWSGTEPISYSYDWLRDKEAIAGASASTYTVQSTDAGSSISCKVTATNSIGSGFEESSNSVAIAASKPQNTTAPEIQPATPAVGETVTCKEGAWTGSAPLTFKYKWLRNGSAEISGAIAQTYAVQTADEGGTLTCVVTAKNAAGESEPAHSAPVTVQSAPVESKSLPTIAPSEKVKAGVQLDCGTSADDWTGSPNQFSYEWLRNGSVIENQSSSTYVTQAADKGASIACEVTARRGTSSGRARSQPVTICTGSCAGAPTSTASPVIEGSPKLGQTLRCADEGNWQNSPTSFVYQWVRSGSENIPDGTAQSYKVQEADEGHELACKVVASNSEGSGKAAASESVHVGGSAPSDVTAPEIVGQARPGEALTCAHGEWHGVPAPTYSYSWKRDGVQVATTVAYAVSAEDRGHTLVCEVTASNSEGAPVSAASAGRHVAGTMPEPLAEPTISGLAAAGAELTCAPGDWSGAPQPLLTYQWLVGGVEVPEATGSTYTVGSSARGLTIACRVTGTNTEGSKSATSKGLHIPGSKPEALVLPTISGTASAGFTLTCDRGIWAGKPPPSFSYRWLRDGVAIAGADEPTYVVQTADTGHLLSCVVHGTNTEGSLEVESTNGAAVTQRVTSTTTGGDTASGGGLVVLPTAREVLASLKRQLAVLAAARIKSLLKTGSYSFSFNSPAAGKFEVTWTFASKAAHGSKRSKPVTVARASSTFSRPSRAKIKLRLTKAARGVLRGKRKLTLTMRASFTLPHKAPVTAILSLTLKS